MSDRRPGDLFLDRYLPGATEQEREEARNDFAEFFEVLQQIATRRAEEDWAKGIRPKRRFGVDSGNISNSPL